MRHRRVGCRSKSSSGLLGLERIRPPSEEGTNAGADLGRKCPQEPGKTVDFKPEDLRGFRNGADNGDAGKRGQVERTRWMRFKQRVNWAENKAQDGK